MHKKISEGKTSGNLHRSISSMAERHRKLVSGSGDHEFRHDTPMNRPMKKVGSHHDVSTGKTAPKSRALHNAKSLKAVSPDRLGGGGRLRSSDEIQNVLKSTPKLHAQYNRQKAERTVGTKEHALKKASDENYKRTMYGKK